MYLYDEWNNFEDYWNVTGIELEPMTGSADETINVDNSVGDASDDGVNNDMGFLASVKNDPVEDVEISIEYFNGVIWTYYANGTTDEDGEYIVENMTDGEYRWEAEYDDDALEEETVSYTEIASTDNISHHFLVDDWDGAGDYDDTSLRVTIPRMMVTWRFTMRMVICTIQVIRTKITMAMTYTHYTTSKKGITPSTYITRKTENCFRVDGCIRMEVAVLTTTSGSMSGIMM